MTMLKNVDNEWIRMGWNVGVIEGKVEGKIEGKVEGKIEDVLAILKKRFSRVPQRIVKSLRKRKDVTAMESLVVEAAVVNSIKEFESLL
jgi:hypothetical protein